MKKTLLVASLLAVVAAPAMAQSSVTLFGVVDLGVRQVSGAVGKRNLLAHDGSGASSRFGVRGVEDLGGGMKAGFWLESSLNADDGTAGFWGRRATVSLMGDFGEVRMGRHKTSHRLVMDDFDPYGTSGMADVSRVYSPLGSGIGAPTVNRVNNQVAYVLPSNLGGLYGSFDVAAGEGTDHNKTISGRLGYKDGPLHVAIGYGTTDSFGSKYKLGIVGASYDLGVLTASVALSRTQYRAAKQNIWQLGVSAPVGPGTLRASFASADANAAGEALVGVGDAKLFALGYLYPLSKRTALFANVAQIKNTNDGRASIAGGTNTPTSAPGGTSRGMDVGVRHSF